MLSLTAAERRSLRAKAHGLHPVVSVGQHGLTSGVLHEIDVNLLAHELIKVRVFNEDRVAREAVLARICAELDAAPVQHIGKLLVVWRPAPAQHDQASVREQTKNTGSPRRLKHRAREGDLRTPSRGAAAPLVAAKSTPQVRRPREPTPRVPSRPPPDRTRSVHSPPSAPGGRRRPRGR
jgi:putative YhbY family RNA-binding protein